MKRMALLILLALAGAALLVGCGQASPAPGVPVQEAEPEAGEMVVTAEMLSHFAPLPAVVEPEAYQRTDALVELGRMLYYENRLSISQEMSCNTCHLLDQYGTDKLPTSIGHTGEPVDRNAPTVYHAALHIAQFWDGRSPTVEEQAKGPVLAGGEMGMPDAAYVERVLRSIPDYVTLFEAAFPGQSDPVNFDNMAIAIGAFERGLMTPSRFDRFLQGDSSQLTEQEQRGLATFVNVGCVGCHNGVAVGGGSYQKLGVVEPIETEDLGRYNVTNDEKDMRVFKVPTLRNIAETGPYLHDGSVESLDEMVRLMGRHQLGQELTDDQVADLVAFLHSLTGDLPMEYIAEPELPASGPDTPGAGGNN